MILLTSQLILDKIDNDVQIYLLHPYIHEICQVVR